MTDSSLPLVSIVTPSYNRGPFIAECVQSVLQQDYPRIEYIVMDGGSSDETPAILRRYADRLGRVISEPDAGQGHAINHGLATAKGEIFAFLNADDAYLPGAVSAAVSALAGNPSIAVVYGNAFHISESGATFASYPTAQFDREALKRRCFICQPAAFIRSEAFNHVGGVDPSLHYALDYDLWLRLAQQYDFLQIEPYLAKSRMYPENKSLSDRPAFYREVFAVLLARCGYVPYEWIQGYASYLVGEKDQFFNNPRNSLLSVPLCLALGCSINKKKMPTFFADWLAQRKFGRMLLQKR